ncbi:MAG: C40 family peptidase, partial [Sciscionella sp.]
ALYAYAKAGVAVPHQTQAIWTYFAHPAITAPADIAPGDLVLLSSTGTPGGIHHVAIYLGDGTVIEAPHSGATVRITHDIWHNPHWSNQFIGAVRPGT